MPQHATNDATNRKGRAACAAPLDPTLLTFLADEAAIGSAARLLITATYPSRTREHLRHRVTVRHDGSFVDCSCDGYRGKHAHCFHQDAAEEIAREYRRRDYRQRRSAALLREDNWYSHRRADSLDNAERICLDALGDVVAERYAAKHGRVDAVREGVAHASA